jgi:hypothetical protein
VVVTYDGWQMEPWYDCCGGDSICMGKWTLGINNQCRQWFLHRTMRVNHEIYNGFGEVSWIFFLSHVTGQPSTVRCRSCETTCTWVGLLSAHGHRCLWGSARGCLGTSSGGVNIRGTLLAWIGWACGVLEKGSDWLGS